MGDITLSADLVRRIEANDASAVAEVEALDDRCLVDSRNRTLFDVAILSKHAGVMGVLASDENALGFSAPIDEKTKDPVKHAVAMKDIEVPVSEIERFLTDAFGESLAFGRTPLHTACRMGDPGVMESLLRSGAQLVDKDITGLMAGDLAFFAHGEAGLCAFLDAFERSERKDLPVGKRLVQETIAFPETLERLLRVAKLDAAARRLLFCYRCAWLDIDAVRTMLADGYELNKGVTAELNPLWEACSSAMLWDGAIPGGLEMAFHYTKHIGHPGASVVSFDNDLLNEDGSNFDKLFAEAERKRKSLVKMVEDMTIAP